MSIHLIPYFYRDNDTVYHYTTSETALSQILKNMQLRLSHRIKSCDPIENTDFFLVIVVA